MISHIKEMVRAFRNDIMTLITSSDMSLYEKIEAFTESGMGFVDLSICYPMAIDNLEDEFIKNLKEKGLSIYRIQNHLLPYDPDKGQTIYYKNMLDTLLKQLPEGEANGVVTLFSYQDEKLQILYSDIVQLFYDHIFTKKKVGFRWDW